MHNKFHLKRFLHRISVVTFGFWANNPSTVLEGSTAVQICVQIMNNVIMGIPVIVELRVIGVTAKSKHCLHINEIFTLQGSAHSMLQSLH